MERGPRQLLATADVSSSDLGVYTIVGSLMAVGVIFILIAAWLFKATKPEMELLSPLERMSERSWKKLDPAMQRRELDDLRPAGARPIARSTQIPSIDEDFEKPVPDVANFDDLTSMQAADVRRRTAQQAHADQAASAVADATSSESDVMLEGDDTTETAANTALAGSETPPRGQPLAHDGDGDEPSGDEI